jgi:hypothetical protein
VEPRRAAAEPPALLRGLRVAAVLLAQLTLLAARYMVAAILTVLFPFFWLTLLIVLKLVSFARWARQ